MDAHPLVTGPPAGVMYHAYAPMGHEMQAQAVGRFDYGHAAYGGEEVEEQAGDTSGTDSEPARAAGAYRAKPRRKATQKPVGSDQKRQAFSKRKRGIVLKAYQLYKLTDAKVFMFLVNDKGSSWCYASPSFGASLHPSQLRRLRELAGLGSQAKQTTEVMAHPRMDEADRLIDDRHLYVGALDPLPEKFDPTEYHNQMLAGSAMNEASVERALQLQRQREALQRERERAKEVEREREEQREQTRPSLRPRLVAPAAASLTNSPPHRDVRPSTSGGDAPAGKPLLSVGQQLAAGQLMDGGQRELEAAVAAVAAGAPALPSVTGAEPSTDAYGSGEMLATTAPAMASGAVLGTHTRLSGTAAGGMGTHSDAYTAAGYHNMQTNQPMPGAAQFSGQFITDAAGNMYRIVQDSSMAHSPDTALTHVSTQSGPSTGMMAPAGLPVATGSATTTSRYVPVKPVGQLSGMKRETPDPSHSSNGLNTLAAACTAATTASASMGYSMRSHVMPPGRRESHDMPKEAPHGVMAGPELLSTMSGGAPPPPGTTFVVDAHGNLVPSKPHGAPSGVKHARPAPHGMPMMVMSDAVPPTHTYSMPTGRTMQYLPQHMMHAAYGPPPGATTYHMPAGPECLQQGVYSGVYGHHTAPVMLVQQDWGRAGGQPAEAWQA